MLKYPCYCKLSETLTFTGEDHKVKAKPQRQDSGKQTNTSLFIALTAALEVQTAAQIHIHRRFLDWKVWVPIHWDRQRDRESPLWGTVLGCQQKALYIYKFRFRYWSFDKRQHRTWMSCKVFDIKARCYFTKRRRSFLNIATLGRKVGQSYF